MTVMKTWTLIAVLALMGATGEGFAESLYQESTYRPLIADNKAFRVGDVLTVQIFENSSAITSADTDTRRKNDVSASWTTPFNSITNKSLSVAGDFDGGGRTQRSNKVLATITVLVTEVLPNGDLKVAGEQMLTVDEELQKVQLQGRVRPQDISDGNLVMSTRLAEAKISYAGEGDIAKRQRRSWWRKVFDFVGL